MSLVPPARGNIAERLEPCRARDRCGIVDLHFHDSRATALTRLSERLDVLELARMVGHRDLKSLMVYYRKTAAQLAYKLG